MSRVSLLALGLTGASSWRVDVLREQQALCRLRLGDREGALDELERILSRYEREPHLALWAGSASLWQAVEATGLRDRLEAIVGQAHL